MITLTAQPHWIYYALSTLIGWFFAYLELAKMFSSKGFKIITEKSAFILIISQAILSGFTFHILWLIGYLPDGASSFKCLEASILAGIGTLTILRTKIITITVSGKPVDIGLNVIIDTFQKILRRNVDNNCAIKDLRKVEELIKNKPVSYEDIRRYLEIVKNHALVALTDEDSKEISNTMDQIKAKYKKDIKNYENYNYCCTLAFGLFVIKYIDYKLFEEIVNLSYDRKTEKIKKLAE